MEDFKEEKCLCDYIRVIQYMYEGVTTSERTTRYETKDFPIGIRLH